MGSGLNKQVCSYAHKGSASLFTVRKNHGDRVVQPTENDFTFFDRSGLMGSANQIIKNKIETSTTPYKCLDQMDPNVTIVPFMTDFDQKKCLAHNTSCLYHATMALNVWRHVNGLRELDTSHIQY